jgi:hypothetical protein
MFAPSHLRLVSDCPLTIYISMKIVCEHSQETHILLLHRKLDFRIAVYSNETTPLIIHVLY